MPTVTADELYSFICEQAEDIDGQLVCRASLIAELRRRRVEFPGRVRKKLVKELTERGLVLRPHPRSTWLVVIDHAASIPKTSRERFIDRMSLGEPGAIEILSPRYEHNARATKRRIVELERYMTANVLAGKRFICTSQRECESSILPGCSFQEAYLSHVGSHYDLRRDGNDMRIVVVGQEVGKSDRTRVSVAERSARVLASGLETRFYAERGHRPRNPHMRGTTLALRAILGTGAGTDRAREFVEVARGPVHIYECFALVNRLLCSAHVTGTSQGRSTKTMLRNCERHFAATLEILQPTIVVIQGKRMWEWSQDVLIPVKKRGEALWECDLDGHRTLVATFTHPSARGEHRWDSPQSSYFREVVRPTLKRARALSLTAN